MKAAMKATKVGGMKVDPKLKKKAVLVGRDGARRLNDAWGTVIKEPFKAKGNAKAKAKAKQGMKVVAMKSMKPMKVGAPSSGTDIKRRPAAAGYMGATVANNAENMGAKVAKQHWTKLWK